MALLWAILAFILFEYAQLTQVYAFTALFFLYISLLVTPLYLALPKLPYKALAIKGRRATGVSAFSFAFLHIIIAWNYLLGGLEGIRAMTGAIQLAFFAGLTASIILFLMTATSLDAMVKRLGKYWKLLHRFVYLAAYLILFHSSVFGSHFVSGSWQSVLVHVLAFILLALEANRLNRYLIKKNVVLETYRYLTYFLVLAVLLIPLLLVI